MKVDRLHGPGAVALAVAKATAILGEEPAQIKVTVSPNVYKNGISVGVPGTGQRGLLQAAALGVYLSGWTGDELGILDHVNPEIVKAAQDLLKAKRVEVVYLRQTPDPLYIKAEVFKGLNSAWTVIQGDYSQITETGKDQQILFRNPVQKLKPLLMNLFITRFPTLLRPLKDRPRRPAFLN